MAESNGLSIHDRPNSYIGRSVPRPNLGRLLKGRGSYADDVKLPRMLHVAFLRSSLAHAEIIKLETGNASKARGVVAVFTGKEISKVCSPWVGVVTHLEGMRSPPQDVLAVDKVRWQGEPLVAVVAQTRALAEDAIDLIEVEYKELPVVVDMENALDADAETIHEDYENNLCWERNVDVGDVKSAFAEADVVIEEEFQFGRHTGVTLESRSIVADYDPGEETLTLYQSTQAPHMKQALFAKHLQLEEHKIRIICRDVGGAFGLKAHAYGDEFATAAISKILGRPVKFVADRMESFLGDIHARDHVVKGKIGISKAGKILSIEIDDLTGIGPYSVYPRSSGMEVNQVCNLTGGPYKFEHYRARGRVVFLNKPPMCQYRAVGHPIAITVTEGLVEMAASAIGMESMKMRKLNMVADDDYPNQTVSGIPLENLSHQASTDKLMNMINYDQIRDEQKKLRQKGVFRGVGFAALIEVTNPGPAFYGVGGAPISAQDGCSIKLDAKGNLIVGTSITEQGQGAEAVISQVVATAVGITPDKIKVISGDTENTPYGGGTWASRGTGIGGEAAAKAGKAIKNNMLDVAGILLQNDPSTLDIQNNQVVNKSDGSERMSVAEIGRVVYYRGDTLPKDFQAEMMVVQHYFPKSYPFAFTNSVHCSHLEVDVNTGFIKLLKHWAVEDCGTVINPQNVEDQVRGGVVQGIGGTLYEECIYNDQGQLLNGNLADYLVPMSAELPDIVVGHVESKTFESDLGAKGAGEAGTAGAPAAIMNALNDALMPFDARLTRQPFTPERILKAIGKI
ncbi:MAG: xanthine dehydrogenase family protein molybdopterin-binding subunit [Pseudomonadota bacterium]|nr:xanthine dehydrogenase family protein molybdopterin-binding subunit [Pseudomonadota bacterium]